MDPLDELFEAANALPPPVPGTNQVVADCVATISTIVSGEGFVGSALLQFTRAKITPGIEEPAFFFASGFVPFTPNNTVAAQTQITLTAPRRGLRDPGTYSLTVQAPMFSQTLSLTPQATLHNATYFITPKSPLQNAVISLAVFHPSPIND